MLRIIKLEDALCFYADPRTFAGIQFGFTHANAPLYSDFYLVEGGGSVPGYRARVALDWAVEEEPSP